MMFAYAKTASLALGVTSLGIAVAGTALSPSGATTRPHVAGAQILRAYGPAIGHQAARASTRRGRSFTVAPSPCPTDVSTSFVGVKSGGNIAGGVDSAVLGGEGNDACDPYSGVGSGEQNLVGYNGYGENSFIAGGLNNVITSYESFVGAGYENEAAQSTSFVGAGLMNIADGQGSFVGAGGSIYAGEKNAVAGGNNAADAPDSFVGAGDLNLIESDATGSFIGGGGSSTVNGDATVGNEISGTDAFVGAGDTNLITGQRAFVGAGIGNNVAGTNGFVGGGGYNFVQHGSGFIGAGVDNFVAGGDAFVGAGGGEYYAKNTTPNAEQNEAVGTDSFVGAGDLNQVLGNGSFIGAGGYTWASTGAIQYGNTIDGSDSFIGAGNQNTIGSTEGFIGSGGKNAIGSSAPYASIVGGNENAANGEYASVIGGYGNLASGSYAIVAGGDSNIAAGTVSYAAGYHADAAHSGSFVWSDYVSGSTDVKDTATNQFVVRASGGTYVYSNEAGSSGVSLAAGSGAWANLSDRNAKTDVVPLDDASVLAKVAALPVSTWRYKTEAGVRHAGPMAQDFYAAFHVGEDDRHITSIDEDGVALAAIKALDARSERENAEKDARIAALAERLQKKDAQIARLAERVLKLESAPRH